MIIDNIKIPENYKKIYIGLSGGVDSMVLLHFIKTNFTDIDIEAIHVNHGIQEIGKKWAIDCAEFCDKLNVKLNVAEVSVAAGGNLEERARIARYSAFKEIAGGGLIALAHHADDVAETLMLRLLRGSGTEAAGNMRELSKHDDLSIWRPLLKISRSDIEDYARTNEIPWVEDPSNKNEMFDRNFIRNSLLPMLEERFPGAKSNLAVSSSMLLADADLLKPYIDDAYNQCVDNKGLILLDKLTEIDDKLGAHVLRKWLAENGQKIGRVKLSEIIRQINLNHDSIQISADLDDGYKFKTWRGRAYIIDGGLELIKPADNIKWRGENDLHLPGGFVLKRVDLNDELTVSFRRGGETIKLPGRNISHNVKKLTSAIIPPWLRDITPYIYMGDELICVGDSIKSNNKLADLISVEFISDNKNNVTVSSSFKKPTF